MRVASSDHDQNTNFHLNRTGRARQQPLLKKIKLLLLLNPVTEWIDTTHAMRLYLHRKSEEAGTVVQFYMLSTALFDTGRYEGTRQSAGQIESFIDFYNINMDEFSPSNANEYKSFEDFFIRKHKLGSCPIAEEQNTRVAVVVADSRVVVFESVSETKKLWVKGNDFSIANLVMDTNIGAKFANGAVASFRLSPQDYHRYHSPVTGKIKDYRSLPGDYYQVDPVALGSKVNILTRNARQFIVVETIEFGSVLLKKNSAKITLTI
jgi:phosphatidylserine decarboxylase